MYKRGVAGAGLDRQTDIRFLNKCTKHVLTRFLFKSKILSNGVVTVFGKIFDLNKNFANSKSQYLARFLI